MYVMIKPTNRSSVTSNESYFFVTWSKNTNSDVQWIWLFKTVVVPFTDTEMCTATVFWSLTWFYFFITKGMFYIINSNFIWLLYQIFIRRFLVQLIYSVVSDLMQCLWILISVSATGPSHMNLGPGPFIYVRFGPRSGPVHSTKM